MGYVMDVDISLYDEAFSSGPGNPRGDIPYYWVPCKTKTMEVPYPMFSHLLLRRDGYVASKLYYYFRDLIYAYLNKHQIPFKKCTRACLNLSYHIPGIEHTDVHVDSIDNHYVIILYLNDVEGNTIIFEKQHD